MKGKCGSREPTIEEKEGQRDKHTQNRLFTLSMPRTEEMLGMEES